MMKLSIWQEKGGNKHFLSEALGYYEIPVLLLFFSRFNFRFSLMVSFGFFFCSFFPLSFFPVSPISILPELIIIRYIY